jgi:hypothetical protein
MALPAAWRSEKQVSDETEKMLHAGVTFFGCFDGFFG